MQLGRVVGTATSTVKHPTFQGERMLVVQLETADGRPDGEPILAFDRLGAGRGDMVLCTNDGAGLQELLGLTTPGRWSVMGLPDDEPRRSSRLKVGFSFMSQASLTAHALESATEPNRFRIPEQARDLADPIKKVDNAVRAVLAELPGQPRLAPGPTARLWWTGYSRSDTPRRCRRHSSRSARPATVVTPLARDLLKRKGITIRLGVLGELRNAARGEWGFAITADSEELGTVQGLRRALLEDPRAWVEIEPSLDLLTSWLVDGEGRGAMMMTTEAAVAVWQSCQKSGVGRRRPRNAARSTAPCCHLGVNLLVVESAGKSISWIKQLAAAFRA